MTSRGRARTSWLIVVCVSVAALVAACSSEEPPDAAASEEEASNQAPDRDNSGEQGQTDQAADPEGPTTDDPAGLDPQDSESSAERDVQAAAMVADLEDLAQPLGEVLGATRPSALEPSALRVTSYPQLCPASDHELVGLLQEDPLLENLPVQRYVLAFESVGAATEFFSSLASTEVGCAGQRETEVSTATATITGVDLLDVEAEQDGIQITASIEVDMVSLDRDPPGADVLRSAVVEGSTVIIVVSLKDYGPLIGVPDVHGPLLLDGIELVRSVS